MVNIHSFFGRTGGTITVAFLQNKLIDKVFDHKKQTKNPKDIHDDIVFIFKTISKKRPSEENNVLHIVEKKYTYTIDLFKNFQIV